MEGIAIPNGTKTTMLSASEVKLDFPEDQPLIEVNPNEGIVTASYTKTYVCTCTGKGCDVVSLGSEVGCSSCTKDCTGKWKTGGGNQYKIMNYDDKNNNELLTDEEETIKYFIDQSQGIQLLTNSEDD